MLMNTVVHHQTEAARTLEKKANSITPIDAMLAEIAAAPDEGEWLALKELTRRLQARIPKQPMGSCQRRAFWRPINQLYGRLTHVYVEGRWGEFDLTPEVAKHVASYMQMPTKYHSRLAVVDVAAADELWKKSGVWIPPGGGQYVKRMVLTRRMVQMKIVFCPRAIIMDTPAGPAFLLEDGNHRFALLRDSGADKMPIYFLTDVDLKRAVELGIVVDAVINGGTDNE